jgi:chromosomal replication initiation ATPase DnaA
MSPVKKAEVITSLICSEYGITNEQITRPNLSKHPNEFTEAKYVAMYLVRSETGYTMKWVGDKFGYSNGGNLSYSDNWVVSKMQSSPDFSKKILSIKALLPELYK